MRIAPLSFFVSATLMAACATFNVMAQDTATVNAIESELSVKQAELDNYTQILDKHLGEETRLQAQLDLLRTRSSDLDKEKNQALDAMNDLYRRLIDDPTVDISEAQTRYKDAVAEHKKNKNDITMQLAAIASHRKDIEQIRVTKHTLINTLENLKDQLSTARVERLRNEFTREGTLEVDHTINCKRTETLAACEQRGQQMALQKATKRFVDQLFANLTEQRLVEPKRNLAGAQVQVLNSHVVSSAFSGQGNYSVNLSVSMRGDVNNSRLCSLISVDNRFCAEYGTPMAGAVGSYQANYPAVYNDSQLNFSEQTTTIPSHVQVSTLNTEPVIEVAKSSAQVIPEKKPPVMVPVTLRSNVYDDEVFINGVSYGSTKLSVKIPAGTYDIEIRKLGYQPYKKRVTIRKAQTINAKLVKKPESIAVPTPKSEQDSTTAAATVISQTPKNEVVIVPAGAFKMGDLVGTGLANERPVVEKVLSNSYGMQSTEVTVGEFRAFIESTGYQTAAEKGRGCAFYKDGEPVWELDYNWQSPGYEQAENFPVVCVSYEDAKAYANWLSAEQGEQFRLPNEVEWEYAARAGTTSEYPWGNEIGKSLANCGWCGSDWSNKSAAPVGEFPPNYYGLYDTVGNVWEWTQKRVSQSGVTVRGGAWNFAPSLARVSTRLELATDFRANYIGFRLVRER
ncbi:SUMF1/EgtB/PvdO family nonheme iron enzyme [Pseudoalteromonas sp. S16_S37]|uniref:SUMF1/EgtB/PvdO family nonheme iron enzyme n=1 Tax=Pseudoalteromonas sp. S16_S37 TaxID=2720228 RepID=UPI001680F9B2|nr:formylglycine-generating enzyme family protein [Pseudoalteromonas sp. S16_S37]MBD1581065.1 SUMF1/EgtB/PvdO family nonheme iron enzyme [Pseudoalteromonas sp. S16_S37]